MNRELSVATAAARRAAAYLKTQFHRPHRISYKFAGKRGIVGEVDRTAEALIIKKIRAAFPRDGILGEESGLTKGVSGRLWVIDALDGSENYYRHIPFAATSIALMDRGAGALGVVALPFSDDLYAAARGHGATVNGARTKVSDVRAPKEATVGFIVSSRLPATLRTNILGRFFRAMKYQRLMGSSVTTSVLVAAGALDVVACMRMCLWDLAATATIVEEAGGKVTDFEGRRWEDAFRADPFAKAHLIFSNRHLHARTIQLVKV